MEQIFCFLHNAFGINQQHGTLQSLSAEDWVHLIDLSFSQGVDAISVDGYHKWLDSNDEETKNCLLETDESLEDLKFEWFGSVLQAEQDYQEQLSAAELLSKEAPVIILKGLSAAENYPIPQHRESVDVDVVTLVENIDIEELITKIGGKIIRKDYKHIGFQYKGVTVEWHRSLTAWKSLKNGQLIEKTLWEALRNAELRHIGDTGLWEADNYFNALFLTVHAYTHFMIEDGITLKHICDWGMFLKKVGDDFWEKFEKTCRQFGMWEFAQTMTRLSEYVCFNPSAQLTDIDRKVLDNILSTDKKHFKNGHLNMAYSILFRNGWKFRNFAQESNISCFIRSAVNSIAQ